MTYFESVGVDYQYNATSTNKAVQAFEKSCDICTRTGMHIECDKCAIASVHNIIISVLKK